VEDDGIDCNVTGMPDSNSLVSIPKLPDPFKKLDGTRIDSKSAWRCRRAEIKKLFETFAYGEKHGPPDSVTGTVTGTSITVNVSHQGKNASFSATVSLPSGAGPFPAVVVLGGMGADSTTLKNEGVAIISFDPNAVGKENVSRSNKQGAYYTIYGNNSTGLFAAWAWGTSRIIDVIAKSDGSVLKADAIGVTGCSRYGKGAFVIGALDQRIALTMPIESGPLSVAIWRGSEKEGGQSLLSMYDEQPWSGDAFAQFVKDPTLSPVDTHEAVAMIAPRGLFLMENPAITQLAPKACHVAALAGGEVYSALGASDNLTFWSDVQDANHCTFKPEWKEPLQKNVRKFLTKKSDSAGGTIKASSKATGSLADWVDWETPVLP
jgi:hypothetical protein